MAPIGEGQSPDVPVRLIGLYSSRPESGKSEVARYLSGVHGWTVVKFAAPIKKMLYDLMEFAGVEPDMAWRYLDGSLKDTSIPLLRVTGRHLMETLGENWGRDAISQRLWCDIAERRVRWYLQEGTNVVIDDVRRASELATIRDLGGKVYRVFRPGPIRASRWGYDPTLEGHLDGTDFGTETIVNDAGLLRLHNNVDRIIMP